MVSLRIEVTSLDDVSTRAYLLAHQTHDASIPDDSPQFAIAGAVFRLLERHADEAALEIKSVLIAD